MRTGGPYYAPRSVRAAALEVLDALFPMGRRSRRLVRLVFRLLHPAEFLGGLFFLLLLPVRVWSWLSGHVLRAALAVTLGTLRLVGLLRRPTAAAAQPAAGGGGGGAAAAARQL
jgi:hypothetical protein